MLGKKENSEVTSEHSVFPGEVMAAPSLELVKARLDGALSTLGW